MAKITVQQISRRAKKIRRPGEKWLTAIRRASAQLKDNKISSTLFIEKGESVRKKPTKVYQRKRTSKGLFKGTMSLSGLGAATLTAELKQRIRAEIDRLVLQKYHATRKTDKRKIQKRITEAKARLIRLS